MVIFGVSTLLLAVTFTANTVLGQPEAIKNTLSGSGIYPALAVNIVDNVVADNQESVRLPLDNPKVREATNQAVSAEEIQKVVESTVDQTYSWLEGETDNPKLTPDLEVINDQIASRVSAAGVNHVRDLPTCGLAELRSFNPETTDPFSWPCRPPGFNPESLRGQYAAEIKKAISEAQESAEGDDNPAPDQQTSLANSNAPGTFQLFQKAPLILGLLSVISGVGIIGLSRSRRAGLRILLIVLIASGGLLIISQLLVNFMVSWLNSRVEAPDVATIQDAILAIITSISKELVNSNLWWGLIYISVGIIGLIGVQFIKGKNISGPTVKTAVSLTPETSKNETLEPKTTIIKPSPDQNNTPTENNKTPQ